MADKACVYFYQERVAGTIPHRVNKIVGAELVLEDKVVLTESLDLKLCGPLQASSLVKEMGRSMARELLSRRISDYGVRLWEKFSGDCIAQEEFFTGAMSERIPEGKIYPGDNVVGHMQQGFLLGLCLDDSVAYRALWDRIHPVVEE